MVRAALNLELTDGTVVADSVGDIACVFLAGLHRAERAIAERLASIAAATLPWPPIAAEKALPWVEKLTGLTLADSQKEAVRLALAAKVLVITGGPALARRP